MLFTCFICLTPCHGTLPESVVQQEARQLWPQVPPADLRLVCDDCFQKVRPDRHQAFARKVLHP